MTIASTNSSLFKFRLLLEQSEKFCSATCHTCITELKASITTMQKIEKIVTAEGVGKESEDIAKLKQSDPILKRICNPGQQLLTSHSQLPPSIIPGLFSCVASILNMHTPLLEWRNIRTESARNLGTIGTNQLSCTASSKPYQGEGWSCSGSVWEVAFTLTNTYQRKSVSLIRQVSPLGISWQDSLRLKIQIEGKVHEDTSLSDSPQKLSELSRNFLYLVDKDDCDNQAFKGHIEDTLKISHLCLIIFDYLSFQSSPMTSSLRIHSPIIPLKDIAQQSQIAIISPKRSIFSRVFSR